MTETTSPLANWTGCAAPTLPVRDGRYVTVRPFDQPTDWEAGFKAFGQKQNAALWRYIPIGPFETAEALAATFNGMREALGWRTHIIVSMDHPEALGMASYMRIRPEHGSAEVGSIVFSENLQRTRAATEAMYLMAAYLFEELGYRRYEWKCHNDNMASRRAAVRFGFTFEGVFRKDMVMNGENRDTAWYSITDDEWPGVKAGFEAWLAPENFNEVGHQRQSLEACRMA